MLEISLTNTLIYDGCGFQEIIILITVTRHVHSFINANVYNGPNETRYLTCIDFVTKSRARLPMMWFPILFGLFDQKLPTQHFPTPHQTDVTVPTKWLRVAPPPARVGLVAHPFSSRLFVFALSQPLSTCHVTKRGGRS